MKVSAFRFNIFDAVHFEYKKVHSPDLTTAPPPGSQPDKVCPPVPTSGQVIDLFSNGQTWSTPNLTERDRSDGQGAIFAKQGLLSYNARGRTAFDFSWDAGRFLDVYA